MGVFCVRDVERARQRAAEESRHARARACVYARASSFDAFAYKATQTPPVVRSSAKYLSIHSRLETMQSGGVFGG